MSLQDRLLTLAAVKFMLARLGEIETVEKGGVKKEVGGRMGATAAMLPDGTEGATISITKPTRHAAKPGGEPYVKNPALFIPWVEERYPEAIVKDVRSTDVPRILAQTFATGELPPGCELTEPVEAYSSGGGSVTVRQTEEQAANVLRALMAGAIPLPSLAPQIEEGDDDDAEA
jgi:hypothetical protein